MKGKLYLTAFILIIANYTQNIFADIVVSSFKNAGANQYMMCLKDTNDKNGGVCSEPYDDNNKTKLFHVLNLISGMKGGMPLESLPEANFNANMLYEGMKDKICTIMISEKEKLEKEKPKTETEKTELQNEIDYFSKFIKQQACKLKQIKNKSKKMLETKGTN